MVLIKLKTATAVIAATVVMAGSGWLVQHASADKSPQSDPAQKKNSAAPAGKADRGSKIDLTAENFAKLHSAIGPQGNEWRHLKVLWYTDIVAARKKAAAEDKPILVFRTGGAGYNDPLGQC